MTTSTPKNNLPPVAPPANDSASSTDPKDSSQTTKSGLTTQDRLTTDDEFHKVALKLRGRCPLIWPVSVRRVILADWGRCDLVEQGDEYIFRILVSRKLDPDMALLILIHEWAHAVSWSHDPMVDDHGPEWGVAHARCYSAAFDTR